MEENEPRAPRCCIIASCPVERACLGVCLQTQELLRCYPSGLSKSLGWALSTLIKQEKKELYAHHSLPRRDCERCQCKEYTPDNTEYLVVRGAETTRGGGAGRTLRRR